MAKLYENLKSLEKKLKDSSPKIPALIKNIAHIEKDKNKGCHWVYVHHFDSNLFDDPENGGLMANAFHHVGIHVFHRGLLTSTFKYGSTTIPYIEAFKSIKTILSYNYNEKIDVEVMTHLRLIFKSNNNRVLGEAKCTWNNDHDAFETRYQSFHRFMLALLGDVWMQQRAIFLTRFLHPIDEKKKRIKRNRSIS